MNAQNQHILKKLHEAQEAVAHLIESGMTVTHISIDGPRPKISLHRPPRKNALPTAWKAIRPKATGGRECEMAACVNGCEVHWFEEDYR